MMVLGNRPMFSLVPLTGTDTDGQMGHICHVSRHSYLQYQNSWPAFLLENHANKVKVMEFL